MVKTKKVVLKSIRQDQLPLLSGHRTGFDSVAEMIVVRAQECPDRPFVRFYDQTLTYAQINARANRVANFLAARGIGKGDVVSLLISNSPEVYIVMFGIQKLGAIAGSINFMLKGPELAYLLDDSRPKMAFVSTEFMPEFSRGQALAAHQPEVIEVRLDPDAAAGNSAETLSSILDRYPADEALVPQKASDPFLLLYSSGTTGQPKGILLKNEGQLSVCRSMASIGLFNPGDVMLILLPMYHTNPICVWTFPIIYCAQAVCIRKAFSPADFWPAITENRVSILMGVPAMYNYVYYSIDTDTIDRSALRLNFAFCGAAPLSVDLIEGFEKKFNVEIIEGYGLTECTGVSTVNPPQGKRKPGSIGVALPGQEIKIMDDKNRELPAGEKGEICIRSKAVMREYLNNPEATADTIVNGWLHTGDIAYMDTEGFIFIVDRKKDMINRGGENIYPREIEIVLEAHPAIKDVAVIGIPDDALGEKVKAFIIPDKSEKITPEDIKTFLQERLAAYKIPEVIEFLVELPRNPTGKIMKKELRRMEMAKGK